MDRATAQALAEGYLADTTTGDRSVLARFSPDFDDNVSGQRGLKIFDVVGTWFEESFADRSADLHLVTHADDVVVVWCNRARPARRQRVSPARGPAGQGNEITWPQVHVFRLEDGLVVEHWAVRDDAALLDSVKA